MGKQNWSYSVHAGIFWKLHVSATVTKILCDQTTAWCNTAPSERLQEGRGDWHNHKSLTQVLATIQLNFITKLMQDARYWQGIRCFVTVPLSFWWHDAWRNTIFYIYNIFTSLLSPSSWSTTTKLTPLSSSSSSWLLLWWQQLYNTVKNIHYITESLGILYFDAKRKVKERALMTAEGVLKCVVGHTHHCQL